MTALKKSRITDYSQALILKVMSNKTAFNCYIPQVLQCYKLTEALTENNLMLSARHNQRKEKLHMKCQSISSRD